MGDSSSHRWLWLALVGAAGVPLALLWDFSWESTIGVDLFFSPPHVAVDLAVALALGAALAQLGKPGVRIGRASAPLGAWVGLWGALAFALALLFDRWWQSGYGLTAGIWHPPQLLKAAGFVAVALGAWLGWAERQGERGGALGFALAGGALLALIGVMTLATSIPNRQHGATFFQVASATFPIALVALAHAGEARFPATIGALAYSALFAALVWILPLVPGSPAAGPVYHARTHLLPAPFPLLLVVPALALDLLARGAPARAGSSLRSALEAGLVFFLVFAPVQWFFAQFLLSPLADGALFAGGGRHWPFFLKIDPSARTAFWLSATDAPTALGLGLAAALAVGASLLGVALGGRLRALRRAEPRA